MNTQPKRLYRSRNNRMIGGVCAGLGEFFVLDPTVIRLLFVFGTLFGFGSFVLIYLVLLVVVPEEPLGYPVTPVVPPSDPGSNEPL